MKINPPTASVPVLPDGCSPALDTAQASAYTGLSIPYLEKLRCVGGGPRFVKYGRRAVRYLKADIDLWLVARTFENTSEAAALAINGHHAVLRQKDDAA